MTEDLKESNIEEKHILVQYIGLNPQGNPVILSRIYKGKKEINSEELNKLLKEKETKLILIDNSDKMKQIYNLDEILKNEYEYVVLKIDYNFNFR